MALLTQNSFVVFIYFTDKYEPHHALWVFSPYFKIKSQEIIA